MAKIGILVPRENMRQEAMELLKKFDLDVVCCRTIRTADTMNAAREAVEAGAQIIIARGYQAKLLREHTKIPLIEIRFSAQEICLFLRRAKEITGKAHPHVAIIAFENMLPDMTYIASLMEVELTVSCMDKVEEASVVLEGYEGRRPDLIIGGEVTCEAARERGYLTLFYSSTTDSIATAMKMARNLSTVLDSEQQQAVRFETVLDSSFNAIVQLNAERTVLSMNPTAEKLLNIEEKEAVGRKVDELLPDVNLHPLDQVLSGSRESMTTSIDLNKEAFMVLVASIRFETRITGAILSFRQLSAMSGLSRQAKRELLLSGYRTTVTFRDLHTKDAHMREMLETAETFALSDSPVLLYEEEGNEASMIARAIHNNSDRKSGPFVSLDIRDLYPEEQVDALLHRGLPQNKEQEGSKASSGAASRKRLYDRFENDRPREGNSADAGSPESLATGAMVRANHGTLFINRIEKLTLQAQHQLLRTLLPWTQIHADARPITTLDVRIIACAKKNLLPSVEADTFSEELYYHFSGLTLSIPALESRPEDLKEVFRRRMEKYSTKYHRHLQVTEESLRLISGLRWPGGYCQVDAFCERLVLSSKKRRIDEQVIRSLYNIMYPEVREVKGEQRLVVYDAPEAQKIRELLEKYDGDRAAVAEELGISKTTLWRHMKKYNVSAKF